MPLISPRVSNRVIMVLSCFRAFWSFSVPFALMSSFAFFFFNDTATTEIYTLSLHDALPICAVRRLSSEEQAHAESRPGGLDAVGRQDRKSTRLNSSHMSISYAVFCLKKKIEIVRLDTDAADQPACFQQGYYGPVLFSRVLVVLRAVRVDE